jgi:hypothetical protein
MLSRMTNPPAAKVRAIMRWLMVAFYATAGAFHLLHPDGLCELAGAAALAMERFRRLAGIMLAPYALCVWPANFRHAFEHIAVPPIPDSWWYHAPRLALQPALIWWALFCSGVVDWPWRRRETRIG